MSSRTVSLVRHLSIAFALLFAAATAARADPPARVGRIAYLSGAVSFSAAPDGDDWTGALPNYPVTSGNRLWTDAGSRADIQIGAATIHLDERTQVDIARLDDESVELFVSRGTALANLRGAARDQPVLVTTPVSQATLEGGGRFLVQVSPNGDRADVTVRRGSQAEIAAGSSVFSAYEDQTATVYYAGDLAYDITAAPAPTAFEHWAAQRDRREPATASLQYVSPATTGYEDLDAYGTWRTTPEYGAVWYPTTVAGDWAPYRYGRWSWVAPWGWTWVDDAPWGFAPFHYGRWAFVGDAWAWVPGQIVVRPVYAPALVAFVGGASLGASLGLADHCGWVPLAPNESYVPWYPVSGLYARDLNPYRGPVPTNGYANRAAPGALTVVATRVFAQGQPINRQVARPVRGAVLPQYMLTAAPPVAQPDRTRLAMPPTAHRPPPAPVPGIAAGSTPPVRMRPGGSSDVYRAVPEREDGRERWDRRADPQRPMPPVVVPDAREPRGHEIHVPDRRPPPQLSGPVPLPEPPAVRGPVEQRGGPVDQRGGRADRPRPPGLGTPDGPRDDPARDVRRLGPPMVPPRMRAPEDRRALPVMPVAQETIPRVPREPVGHAPPSNPNPAPPAPAPAPARPAPQPGATAPGSATHGATAPAPAPHAAPGPGQQPPPGQAPRDGGPPREHRQEAR